MNHVDAGNPTKGSFVNRAVTSRKPKRTLEGTVEPATAEEEQKNETEQDKNEGVVDSPLDQHDWDEATFKKAAEKALLSQGIQDEHQRDRIMEILVQFKELWIEKSLGQVDLDYETESPTWQPPITL